jgi:predicted hotdog family 3-hydroxylacyl-ACP dehydratase
MIDASAIPIGELLPHGPEMTLIDRLVVHEPRRSTAVVTITKRSRFFRATGVPAWGGIEYMAQTIAAHAGVAARLRGEPRAIGYLLGTRSYSSTVAEFALGSTLEIVVEPELVETKLAMFKCEIRSDRELASAVVTTYRPAADELAALRVAGRP